MIPVRARFVVVSASLVLAMTACSTGSSGSDGSSASSASDNARSCTSGPAPSFSGSTTAFDAPAGVEPTGALSAQVSEPTLASVASPAQGYKIASVKVNARVLTNGVFALHPESFVLVDTNGIRCGQPATNSLPNALKVAQVDETSAATGTLAFVVPAEANLSAYSVYYLDRPGSAKATAKWSGSGVAPSATTVTTCSTNKSGIVLSGAKDQEFGKPFTAGDSEISETITPQKPTVRALKPGPDQPNDVSGVQISLTVAAKGSLGFVDRNQFQLLDSQGNLCQYNELGSDGENLTSDLVDAGKSKTYTIVFWTPTGSSVPGWKLLYVPEPTDKKATASWTLKPASTETASPTTPPPASDTPTNTASSTPSTSS